MAPYPGFVGASFRSPARLAGIEDLVNWYLAKNSSPHARSPYVLAPTPGFAAFAALGAAPVRGLVAQSGRAWTVADNVLAEFFGDGTKTNRGVVLRDGNPVTMVANGQPGNQLFVTSGGHKYILNLTSGLVTDKGAGATSDVVMGDMLDGFFLALEGDRFSISEPDDGLTWDPTQFEQRATAPDPWKALRVVKNRIYLIGEQTGDIWYNAGDATFPFKPVQGALIRDGIAAPFSMAEFGDAPIWLAQDRNGARTIVTVNGYVSQKVSTPELDYELSRYSRVDDAEAFTYQERGVEFYVLNFPTANATWALDKDGGWHRRGTWNVARGDQDVWHPRCHCYAFGKHLVGDRTSDALLEMSVLYGVDAPTAAFPAGAPIVRDRVAPALGTGARREFLTNFTLLVENGVGLAQGQGSDPVVLLRKSKDGGETWGPERPRHIGKQGETLRRVRWNRMGSALNPALWIRCADPVPWYVVGALINEADEAV